MAGVDISIDEYDVEDLLKTSLLIPDLVVDGIHFGRGDAYYNENTSIQLKHKTVQVKCWRIVEQNLEEIGEESNNFYSCETYIVQWKSITDNFRFNTDDVLSKQENNIYFYWRGEGAVKGYSPLPESIEKENPPVERIVQWSEPPAFLQLFSGTLIVHSGKQNSLSDDPHLYILRGEMDKELHLYEVELKKESLRSRTSFVLHFSKEKGSIIWHGSKSSSHYKNSIKKTTEKVFGKNITEIDEGFESEKFTEAFKGDSSDYFVHPVEKVIDYTPRLFYFNKIIGKFSTAEIECSHKSSYLTTFPFLQSHLYTAEQPAIFLLDDNDEIWVWYGWERDEDDEFKSECFVVAINYAKQKSKRIKQLVRIHKVIAGFEPNNFTNLFPVWKKREDIAQLQEKDGVLPSVNPIIEMISYEDVAKA
ncbi:hypothetical protein Zmor_011689 [Zophobas morio]|uniref:Supervillin n=1 Tax=Zophobas morio TaxID=2755281 RepID=A0AA38IRF4_9CUCU|nr:hypothetical protein Zmor_011689 [Zophobas morio]